MKMRCEVLKEPLLEFGNGQLDTIPQRGLSLFGPYDVGRPTHPSSIKMGIIGTSRGINRFLRFYDRISGNVSDYRSDDIRKNLLWPMFPGLDTVYHCSWNIDDADKYSLDAPELEFNANLRDPHERAFNLTNCYLNGFKTLCERDYALDLIICVEPDEIWKNCRPRSSVGGATGPTKGEIKKRRQYEDLFKEYDPRQYDYSVDFRRQLKARSMEYNMSLQLIKESTLELDDPKGVTCLSDRAWNLSLAMYYKAGGKPWQLSQARPGVCYVGLVFKKDESDNDPRSACCAAQMFLNNGDGVVFRGDFGPWYSGQGNQFHLDKKAAANLLAGVLDSYHKQGGQPVREVFLHSRSIVSDDEYKGYLTALPAEAVLSVIRVRTDPGFRAYREGDWPVLRGTLIERDHQAAYLWGSGFKSDLIAYDGWEIPSPLKIDVLFGNAPVRQVAHDIFGLTKLNYNACKFGDSEPVTIGFSDRVGEILVTNKHVESPRPNFKFYI
jgi:hypothetical protein